VTLRRDWTSTGMTTAGYAWRMNRIGKSRLSSENALFL